MRLSGQRRSISRPSSRPFMPGILMSVRTRWMGPACCSIVASASARVGFEGLIPAPGQHAAGQASNRFFVVHYEHGVTAGRPLDPLGAGGRCELLRRPGHGDEHEVAKKYAATHATRKFHRAGAATCHQRARTQSPIPIGTLGLGGLVAGDIPVAVDRGALIGGERQRDDERGPAFRNCSPPKCGPHGP